jgi:ribosomal protein S18 acetylase RimI-like enzyme
MSYNIIPIEEKHIDAFRDAVGTVAKEGKFLALLDTPSIEKVRAFILEQLENKMPHYVAMTDDTIVGWCDIASFNRPALAHSGVLRMGVIKSHRGTGLGGKLMRIVIDKAKEIGITRIELEVREDNTRAIEFYTKFGFEVEGVKRNACKTDGAYSNILIMGLLFDE